MTDTDQAKAADAAAKQRTEDVKKHADEARKKLADERSAREKATKEHAKMVADVKPTPTQEECDLAASGVYLAEHEPDGSPEATNDPTLTPLNKQAEAGKAKAGYQTKSA